MASLTAWEHWNYQDGELWAIAKKWCDAHSGNDSWRVTEVAPLGFWYDGPGFFSPQFKQWAQVEMV